MKIQMRIKKGYPGQGQEDKNMIKKGYPKLRKNQGRIKKGYPGQGQKDKKRIKKPLFLIPCCGSKILIFIGRGIEPENVCFVGGTTDKSQWLHKLF